ncbi:hypothetical protein NM688_g5640 [Phlebia brevispora]|uniref:Uncharacterized protein n=1 Tax=Phlebia brevispora TaxID=194682 RepID=A0ACC1SSE0_9APHY|nr:hypothetical protein NM688_g5640 [Phlebia brevispora]
MCGILFLLRTADREHDACEVEFNKTFERLKTANAARGPDAQDTVKRRTKKLEFTYFDSELRLRGHDRISQPHRDAEGNLLCWNGEVFEGMDITLDENDGAKLFSRLRTSQTTEDIIDLFGSIEGPYAFVYYHHDLRRIFFARDPLGRRSLLIHKPSSKSPRFLLASVSVGLNPAYSLEELSTEYIYSLEVESLEKATNLVSAFSQCLQFLPRQNTGGTRIYGSISKINRTIPSDLAAPSSLKDIPEHISWAVDQLVAHLDSSVRLRVCTIPREKQDEGKAHVAVLFSGGIDSTMIAYLAHWHIPPDEPIDLLNVAFENPRKMLVRAEGNIGGLPKREKKQKLKNGTDYSAIEVDYSVPDRVTGLQELEELRSLCPGRIWNFVEVNVPYEEYQNARETVENIMFPGRTVMDLSLAMALYFAARGEGQARNSKDGVAASYTSPARVLLNGLGSDELLGGYGRFRTAYKHGGWEAIINELQLELDRIPTRNLGRDDRVISSHGKETRHPFLSLSVVSFLAQLPVHLKLDPRLEAGLGEKMLLRMAANKVGLVEASSRKKRAMQFGSHSARMTPGEADKKGDILLDD